MCLAVPMKIIKIDGNEAVAEAYKVETVVNTTLFPEIKLNDKVLVHAGFIIEKLDPDEARAIEETWDEYLKIQDEI
ncbi:MAG: HypC/HybG/HupF family hydrogenase formation chaperone [Spirochaetota bacterium]|nr:HypC/HybG/HupF family hydrogenase formation chaperone [Spirochaetota bacterium]